MSSGSKKKTTTPPFELCNLDGRLNGRLAEGFVCPDCAGQGFRIEEDDQGYTTRIPCTCMDFSHRLKLLNEAGIPGKFAETQFETYHPLGNSQRLALKMAKDFAADFGPSVKGLLFMGQPGLGKTHLAVSILRELILKHGIECRFVDFFQLLSDIRHGYSQDLSEQAIINPYVHAPVLVIDELAKGRNTEWEQTMLDQIISSRYNAANRITLFTTNHLDQNADNEKATQGNGGERVDPAKSYGSKKTGETLAERLGPRIYSRLTEMCRFVKMEGEDYRPHMVIPPATGSRLKHSA